MAPKRVQTSNAESRLQASTEAVFSFNYSQWFFGKDKFTDILIPSLAEFAASALFVFICCGAAMNTQNFKEYPGAVDMQIALVFGFTITALAFTIGHISGGHINFAVTFAFVLSGRISPMRGTGYFLGQFFGGLVGAFGLKYLMPLKFIGSCYAANGVSSAISLNQAFFMEFFLTFFLLFVVSAATDSQKNEKQGILTPLAIGLCIYCCHIIGIPFTGTSINPTRTFASAVAASDVAGCEKVWDNHALFWFAPLLGAVVATWIYQFSFAAVWGEGLTSQYRNTEAVDEPVLRELPQRRPQQQLSADEVYNSGKANVEFDPRFDTYPNENVQAHDFA